MGMHLIKPDNYVPLKLTSFLPSYSRCDRMARVHALTLLAKLSTQSKYFGLLQELLKNLVQTFEQLQKMSGFKSFSNSHSHRQKHRILCAFFLLEPIMDQVSFHFYHYIPY
jgi:hypothetical protein